MFKSPGIANTFVNFSVFLYICTLFDHQNYNKQMGKVLIIGAGGVGNVVVRKCARLPEVFSEIMLASRTKSKCDAIANDIKEMKVQTAALDADDAKQVAELI